jgi:hypothetical protein
VENAVVQTTVVHTFFWDGDQEGECLRIITSVMCM